MPLPIEEYAVIGDTGTAALIGSDGSLDWLCLPRFDSPACFAALLGGPENGRWLLGPVGEARCERRYVGHTPVLESTYTTGTGSVRIVDSMPIADGRADVVRQVTGLEGTVRLRHEWVVRFGYGRIRPWIHRADNDGVEVITAVAGPDRLVLRGPRLPRSADGIHEDEFDVRAGEELTFSLTWVPSHRELPEPLAVEGRIEETLRLSEQWVDRCTYRGRHRDQVLRSLMTLRLLTHGGTGGIVAAPTTSLPEDFGGGRNWDYRFCWLRDASLTLEAFLACGYHQEARLWRDWLLRAVAGDPADLQIMYAVDGGRELPERELDHLAGYAGSTPVRVGNAAVDQRQTDVLGEVMAALHMARELGLDDTEDSWALQTVLVEELAEHWQKPDHGLWEIRGPAQHFTHSRVMVWVAFDRAVQAVEKHGLPGPADRWREVRDAVRAEILERGFDPARGTFTQHYDTTEVDAALLVLPSVGFIDGDDPRMLGTIKAVEEDLVVDGLVRRYRTESGVDGLGGGEAAFLACSFWLVTAYAQAGLVPEARELLDRLLLIPNDLGLLPEEYDPVNERFVGNYPQAFSHLTLVEAVQALDLAEGGAVTSSRGAGLPGVPLAP
ncbi:glycoside hydrolase family 15 protein [Nocardioides mesophilus]|uniref:Glycoside hydrolase family 15 protein n=1 Tax=Nocardioides mesophilus TaxID=433659 RepID=A0A7G9R9G8_9ACTN|nr:glycoside hydrolase family 15 protein [Nocardioides mesophilus]QNN52243.1 glycoside hydrolase family 15 protein [Nocardioides mesophilus]